jgi:hypothetical protein
VSLTQHPSDFPASVVDKYEISGLGSNNHEENQLPIDRFFYSSDSECGSFFGNEKIFLLLQNKIECSFSGNDSS